MHGYTQKLDISHSDLIMVLPRNLKKGDGSVD